MTSSTGDYTTLVPVTGEAVALDLRIAQFPSRTLALALDLVVQCGVLVAVGLFAVSVASQVDGAAATAIVLVAIVMVIVGMPTLIETLTRGRSLGKLAAGLRVVRDDGGPARCRVRHHRGPRGGGGSTSLAVLMALLLGIAAQAGVATPSAPAHRVSS